MKNILFLLTGAMVFCASCASAPKDEGAAWLQANGDGIVSYAYTKAEIEAEIDTNWEALGYTERPVKYIAISFDDGPCPPDAFGGTEAMLKTLEDLNVKATFFVIGSQVRNNKAAAQAVYEAGHDFANHSDSYDSLGGSAVSNIASSLDAASKQIKEITGAYPCIFRAPNLNHGDNLSLVCRRRGMALINGSVHSDWSPVPAPEAIRDSVLSNPKDGDIIVLHDNNTSEGKTMAALPEIVAGLREKGFWICTIGQLAAVKGKTLKAGMQYNSI